MLRCMRARRWERVSRKRKCAIRRSKPRFAPHSGQRTRFHHRRYRLAQRGLEPGADDTSTVNSATARSYFAEKGTRAPRSMSAAAQAIERAISRHVLLLPGGDITGQILNFGCRASRSADFRPQPRNYEIAQQLVAKIATSPARRTCTSISHGLSGDPAGRGPLQGRAIGHDAARRQQQHADLAEREYADLSAILAELE